MVRPSVKISLELSPRGLVGREKLVLHVLPIGERLLEWRRRHLRLISVLLPFPPTVGPRWRTARLGRRHARGLSLGRSGGAFLPPWPVGQAPLSRQQPHTAHIHISVGRGPDGASIRPDR
jgi:hypothetical protein